MVESARLGASPTHEIRLCGEIPASMREQFPSMAIYHSSVESVLFREVAELAELDLLLEKLQSMGLVLSELHERSPRFYEVHVEGELGSALLRYLHWSNRTQPEQSVLRIDASPADLQRFLSSCAERGLTVERITRIDSVADQGPIDPPMNLARH